MCEDKSGFVTSGCVDSSQKNELYCFVISSGFIRMHLKLLRIE